MRSVLRCDAVGVQFAQDALYAAIHRLGMELTGGKFLFMGDYVDRGLLGLEVSRYPLCKPAATCLAV